MTNDEKIEMERVMKRCIALAKKGAGYVSPNPLVGCVIIESGKVIGEGYHKKYGEPHAEANAIENAKHQGFSVKGAKLYVNLEPCSHFGKRPPCANLLVQEKISEVIIGMKDPFKKVDGKGINILKKAGIKVTCGILEDECKELNKFFITYVTQARPYITLKIAQSLDGTIALNNNKSKFITNKESRKYVHQMRSEYDAVLIGKNTALYDDPDLTVREAKGRNPIRIVIDKDLTLPNNLKLFTDSHKDKTFIVSNKKDASRNIIFIKGKITVNKILDELYKMNINSVIVEGGGHTFSQFVQQDLFDDIYTFIAPKIIGSGKSSYSHFSITVLEKAKKLRFGFYKNLDNDILLYYKK